jgi:MFS transporter, ACS family, solute carrier family 17 (sodium-dependent inorganic phosphate cotransporter), other
MVIFGFMLNYALRVNLTIAIVEMLDPHNATVAAVSNETNGTSSSLLSIASESVRFDWTESQKQLILGSFFWGYILTELPGGRLAELIGGHRVFGHSMLWASVLTLITPFAANMGYIALTILRAVLGFMLGGELP